MEKQEAIENLLDAANDFSDAFNQPREILTEVMAQIILTTQGINEAKSKINQHERNNRKPEKDF